MKLSRNQKISLLVLGIALIVSILAWCPWITKVYTYAKGGCTPVYASTILQPDKGDCSITDISKVPFGYIGIRISTDPQSRTISHTPFYVSFLGLSFEGPTQISSQYEK